jgi:hypothetical protein
MCGTSRVASPLIFLLPSSRVGRIQHWTLVQWKAKADSLRKPFLDRSPVEGYLYGPDAIEQKLSAQGDSG